VLGPDVPYMATWSPDDHTRPAPFGSNDVLELFSIDAVNTGASPLEYCSSLEQETMDVPKQTRAIR